MVYKINQSALLVIDVQGRLAHMMHESSQLFEQISIQIKACQILDIPIFWLEQYPQGLGETISEIKSLLSAQQPLEKITFSSCGENQFNTALTESGRQQLVVTGIETHVCVYQTVMDLLANDYQVAVNQDAVSSRTASNKQLGLQRMQAAGAQLTSTEMILFEWMETAQHPRFKDVTQLLK